MAELNTITDPYLPEPKGVSSATDGDIYVADGAGSGAWGKPYLLGIEDYNDSGGTQNLTSGSWIDLTNDGAGSFTNKAYQIPSFSDIWDTGNNQFDWLGAGLSLGDTVDIRFDVTATTAAANDIISLRLDMAHGDAGEYNLNVFTRQFKSASTQSIVVSYSLYMGDTATLNNPAKVAMFTDNTGNSVVLNGWFVRVLPQHPVYV